MTEHAEEARGRAAARRAAHVLIDMLVATAGADELGEDGIEAVQLARQRIYEIDAIRITPDHAGGYLVDATPLLNGALNLLHWLAGTLADKADADYDDVLLDLRQQLEDWERGAS